MGKTPTIYDVAERAGVSKSLVSLVLRGSPRVSDAKRDAVLSAMAELNYTPSKLAAGLAGAQTRSVGIVIDEFENLWFAPVLAGLRTALREGGYQLSVADVALNSHLRLDPVEVFRALRVDGVVLAGEIGQDAADRLSVPAVVLGTRQVSAPSLPVVAGDEPAGGALAVRHLAELGHRRIICMSAPGPSAAAREAGYVAEMQRLGLQPQVLRAAQTSESAARAAAAAALGLSVSRLGTAVFAVNDPMAVGVIGAARGVGMDVPRDLSVVGYDDSPLAGYGLVSLTTVSGESEALGEAAGSVLATLMAGGPAPEATQLLLPELVVRGSTAKPGGVS